MRPRLLLALAAVALAVPAFVHPAYARDALGIFSGWGAFRDASPLRCYAIAQPEEGKTKPGQPFATVSWWPIKGVRGQFYVSFSRMLKPGSPVNLVAGGRRWLLTAGSADAWSPSARHDSFILAKLRSSPSFSVSGMTDKGNRFVDTYPLAGAASAFDAAALGCAKAQ